LGEGHGVSLVERHEKSHVREGRVRDGVRPWLRLAHGQVGSILCKVHTHAFGIKECSKKDIQLGIIFGLGKGGYFERGKGNLFVVLGEGVCV